MWLIYLYSTVSIALVLFATFGLIRGKRVLRDANASAALNQAMQVLLLAIGAIGILATAPGILWGDWNWLLDTVFRFFDGTK